MTSEEFLFFDQWPGILPIYGALKKALTQKYPDMKIKVSKTQISFYNRHMFAMVSLPNRRRKNWPKEFLMVSFGLGYQKESDRIVVSTEAYPNRWTHHVLVKEEKGIDAELLSWMDEAYAFSMDKR